MRAFLAAAATLAVTLGVTSPGAGAQPGPRARAARSQLSTVKRALAQGVKLAGRSSGAYVDDLTTGQVLFASAASTPRLPASVQKLYTTSTALLRFGPQANLVTSVYGVGQLDANRAWNGKLYLRGGGDPTFGSASYDQFAYGTGATLQRLVTNLLRASPIRSVHGAIIGDESYFDSRRGTPATGYAAGSYVEGQLSALIYDRGFADQQGTTFQRRPALFSTDAFAGALRAARVKIPASTRIYTGSTPPGAKLLTVVHSPRLATLIKLTNTPSDNYFAEMLLKGLGARFAHSGTTAAGVAVVKAQIAKSFGIHPSFDDGSGLSYGDHSSPLEIGRLLAKMASNPDFMNSLAVAGETGTLSGEMNGTVAQGKCRGKTGTLSAVSNLVGYCTARNGHTLAFAFLMNAVDPNAAHPIQNAMAEALAAYDG
ncbi:MAG: D-alanyl-D-alanine carboxypeptidase/D-alanyl-D-alanine-endopeptidase [Actinomycetota bacterium]|nr:D-alanyl-D-alanine carboxypeptidase/D-alanyl-D-alanine-endopeptidase [Actinomycetota bacterium]